MALEDLTSQYKSSTPASEYTTKKAEPQYQGLRLVEEKQLEGGTGKLYWM